MELKQIGRKKSLKLLLLLFTSLLIGTVSATTYVGFMYMSGNVTVGTAKMIWVKGSGATNGTTISISGGTVTVDLSPQTGLNQTFINSLYLKNTDTVTHYVNISVTTALSPSANFTSAEIYIYSNNSTSGSLQTISMTTTGTYSITAIAAGSADRLDFEIYTTPSTNGSFNFAVEVAYK